MIWYYDVAIKLRPNGGLTGIDNSSLNKFLSDSKILQLQVILHDAAALFTKNIKLVPAIVIC